MSSTRSRKQHLIMACILGIFVVACKRKPVQICPYGFTIDRISESNPRKFIYRQYLVKNYNGDTAQLHRYILNLVDSVVGNQYDSFQQYIMVFNEEEGQLDENCNRIGWRSDTSYYDLEEVTQRNQIADVEWSNGRCRGLYLYEDGKCFDVVPLKPGDTVQEIDKAILHSE